MGSSRFVVLRHEPGPAGPRDLHWDLMLESGGHLRTWALDCEPAAGETIGATSLANHRQDYLSYEGPVSDGRGIVKQFDRGTYQIVSESSGQIELRLDGTLLCGGVTMTRESDQRWSVAFESG